MREAAHTDSTEGTDEPNLALLLEIREHESFKSRELKYIRWICEICVLFLLFNVDVVVRMWGEDAKKWENVMEFAIFLLYLPI